MYWHIGELINREVLGYERADYGKQIVATLSQQLTWSHFVEILPLKDDLHREFYLTMDGFERWSRNTLRSKIAKYMTELPDKSVLQAQLHKQLEIAKQQFGNPITEME